MITKNILTLLNNKNLSTNRVVQAWIIGGMLILGVLVCNHQSAITQENVCNILVLCSKNSISNENVCKVTLIPENASDEVQGHADWIVNSKDNQDMPFVILDKKRAKIFVFQKDGQNLGSAPALLGIAIGDNYVPGTGQKQLSEIPFKDRTTPAGRFIARLGKNSHGEEVLWVDYDMAIAIHGVVTGNPKDHRLERLQSQNPKDHRISFGCINVPTNFYSSVISPLFTRRQGVVYVLPETA